MLRPHYFKLIYRSYCYGRVAENANGTGEWRLLPKPLSDPDVQFFTVIASEPLITSMIVVLCINLSASAGHSGIIQHYVNRAD